MKITPKKGEIFFIYPIGSMTERAVRDALSGLNLDGEMRKKIHSSKGMIPVIEVPVSFVENITENPSWTNHKFVIYHELNDNFTELQPKKGKRRPPLHKGKQFIPMSALRIKTKRVRGKNV